MSVWGATRRVVGGSPDPQPQLLHHLGQQAESLSLPVLLLHLLLLGQVVFVMMALPLVEAGIWGWWGADTLRCGEVTGVVAR